MSSLWRTADGGPSLVLGDGIAALESEHTQGKLALTVAQPS